VLQLSHRKKAWLFPRWSFDTLEHKRTKPPVAFFYDEYKKENDK